MFGPCSRQPIGVPPPRSVAQHLGLADLFSAEISFPPFFFFEFVSAVCHLPPSPSWGRRPADFLFFARVRPQLSLAIPATAGLLFSHRSFLYPSNLKSCGPLTPSQDSPPRMRDGGMLGPRGRTATRGDGLVFFFFQRLNDPPTQIRLFRLLQSTKFRSDHPPRHFRSPFGSSARIFAPVGRSSWGRVHRSVQTVFVLDAQLGEVLHLSQSDPSKARYPPSHRSLITPEAHSLTCGYSLITVSRLTRVCPPH